MILELTPDQAAALRAESKPGRTILAAIGPEVFDHALANADTSGRLRLEFGSVPTVTLPALRAAILKANTKPKKRTRKNHEHENQSSETSGSKADPAT